MIDNSCAAKAHLIIIAAFSITCLLHYQVIALGCQYVFTRHKYDEWMMPNRYAGTANPFMCNV